MSERIQVKTDKGTRLAEVTVGVGLITISDDRTLMTLTPDNAIKLWTALGQAIVRAKYGNETGLLDKLLESVRNEGRLP